MALAYDLTDIVAKGADAVKFQLTARKSQVNMRLGEAAYQKIQLKG